MLCAYCLTSFWFPGCRLTLPCNFDDEDFGIIDLTNTLLLSRDMDGYLWTEAMLCPICSGSTVWLLRSDGIGQDLGLTPRPDDTAYRIGLAFPQGGFRWFVPPHGTPPELKRLYMEAQENVMDNSSASVILIRKLLEHVLRKKGYMGRSDRLYGAIERLIDNPDFDPHCDLPSVRVQGTPHPLHALRELGNRAAHSTDGEDVEKFSATTVEESAWCLNTMHKLLMICFEEPDEIQKARREYEKKVRDARREFSRAIRSFDDEKEHTQ